MLNFRTTLAMLALGMIAAACSPATTVTEQAEPPPPTETNEPAPTETATAKPTTSPTKAPIAKPTESPYECGDPFNGERPSFSTSFWKTDFCQHSVDYSEIFSGGPPPDGIPAIDRPEFVDVASADEWLEDSEPVIALTVGKETRAYPLQIMIWHEIVNDQFSDLPVVVTFCPLCNTALVFERPTVDGEVLDFGTSGNLRFSDLVMYDRQTHSWWQQFSGEGIVGKLTSMQLTPLPAALIAWSDFKATYPDGQVLSLNTGYNRPYGENPYAGYDDVNAYPFLFSGKVDQRLRPMDRVLGILLDDQTGRAYPYTRLSEEEVINDVIDGTPVVIFWKAGTASALDSPIIALGRDVGATGVFEAFVDGETLTFISNYDGTFKDENTGSTWDILGQARDGPLVGIQLRPIPHHDTFWFAWAAFMPADTLTGESQ